MRIERLHLLLVAQSHENVVRPSSEGILHVCEAMNERRLAFEQLRELLGAQLPR